MKSRRLLGAWVLIAGPAVLALVGAGIWWLLGERRQMYVQFDLPMILVVLGLLASAVVASVLGFRRWHNKRVHAVEHGVRQQTKQQHRTFLSRLDHELKNPLTAIRAALSGLNSGNQDEGALRIVDSQSERIATLVAELRKIADLETTPLEVTSVEIPQLLGDVIATVQQEIQAQMQETTGREWSYEVANIPWPVETIAGDDDLLFVAFYNLISNAVKYSSPGNAIVVRVSQHEGAVRVEISDTGRGIPDADTGEVFEQLARASNVEDIPGSGLGLSLVHTIIHRHGGAVALESREGVGTKITVILPHNFVASLTK